MESLSIIKPNFGQKNSKMAVVLLSTPFLLGICSVFLNWKAFLCAVVIVGIFYGLRKYAFQYSFAKTAAAVAIITLGYLTAADAVFHVSVWETLLSAFLLSFIFCIKYAYQDSKTASDFEVFLINETHLKCIVTKTNDYKGYALHPKGYVKWFLIKDITALHFSEKHLTVSLGAQRLHARELNANDLKAIHAYCVQHFPKLLVEK